jgi:thiol:disulfide interchange protein DsbC
MKIVIVVTLILVVSVSSFAMSSEGCGAGTCNSCHSLTIEEAQKLFPRAEKIHSVDFSEMPGVFVVEVEGQGRKNTLYVDFSKKYVVAGNVYRLSDGQNISATKKVPEATEVDPALISVEDAILLGQPDAKYEIIVFSDPDCPGCRELHKDLKALVKTDPEIAVQLLMFPLPMHKEAYGKAKSIVCSKSLDLLDAAYSGAPVPPAICETEGVNRTIRMANELGIKGTPTLVFPDGRVKMGRMTVAELIAAARGK